MQACIESKCNVYLEAIAQGAQLLTCHYMICNCTPIQCSDKQQQAQPYFFSASNNAIVNQCMPEKKSNNAIVNQHMSEKKIKINK
jgi:hypothetical protein